MKIAIIGNGASLLNYDLGKTIDKFDEVVRFNDFRTKGYEYKVGTKTTIWARNTGKDEFVLDEKYDFKTVLVQHTRFINEHYDPTIVQRPNHVEIHPGFHDIICEFCEIEGLNTSTGIQTIAYLATQGEVSICGFDCFKPPRKYFELPIDLRMPHSTKESLYIEYLLNSEIIKSLVPRFL